VKLAIALAALLTASALHAGGRPVVLLTDIGMDVDDQWALAHLATSPRFALRAVVTSHAANLPSPAAEVTAAAARATLARVAPGRFVPVIAGSSVPLARPGAPESRMGAELLCALARRHGPADRLAVLVIGPTTDLAAALALEPALADRIEVVAMGFKRWPTGGNSWNVRQDVRAWQQVVAARVPLTIGCDAVCVRDLSLTAREAAVSAGPSAAGRYLSDLLRDNMEKHGPREARRLSGRPDAWPVWDEIAVAHLAGFTTAITSTRPALAPDQTFSPSLVELGRPVAGPTLTWITRVDAAGLWRDLRQGLER
jgi:purine nucleosidase